MGRIGAAGVGEHENEGSEGEAEGSESENEDHGIETAELLSGDGGVEVVRRDSRMGRWSFAVAEGLWGSHGCRERKRAW